MCVSAEPEQQPQSFVVSEPLSRFAYGLSDAKQLEKELLSRNMGQTYGHLRSPVKGKMQAGCGHMPSGGRNEKKLRRRLTDQ